MSSHRLSVSGDRPWTHSAGGGVASAMQYSAREGDGVQFSLSSVAEITVPLEGGARIEKRRYEGRRGSDDSVLETYVLVMDRASFEAAGYGGHASFSINVLGRTETGYPVTNVDVRKRPLDEPDNAWAGWGEHEVLGSVQIPRFQMGLEDIAAKGGTAPAYVGEADPIAKLDAADALLTNIEAATADTEQAIAAARAAIDSARAGLLPSGTGQTSDESAESSGPGPVAAGEEFPEIESGRGSESA